MNFLAHQLLSFNCPGFMVGNFIADSLRGRSYLQMEKSIVIGVEIHRAIDHFTDTHRLVLETRFLLYPYFGKYASVVQDVYYDHFLAIGWTSFSEIPLKDFVQNVYDILGQHQDIFNEKSQRTFLYMSQQDWLSNYQYLEGIDRSLKGLSRRAKYHSNMENGLAPLEEHFQAIRQHFEAFFPELTQHIAQKFKAEIAYCDVGNQKQ